MTMLRLGREMTERHTLKRERAIAGGRDEKKAGDIRHRQIRKRVSLSQDGDSKENV